MYGQYSNTVLFEKIFTSKKVINIYTKKIYYKANGYRWRQ